MHIYKYIAIIFATGTRNSIAVQVQFDAVDISMKLRRCEEEVQQVMREMKSYLLYFKDKVLAYLHHSAKGNYMGSRYWLVCNITYHGWAVCMYD